MINSKYRNKSNNNNYPASHENDNFYDNYVNYSKERTTSQNYQHKKYQSNKNSLQQQQHQHQQQQIEQHQSFHQYYKHQQNPKSDYQQLHASQQHVNLHRDIPIHDLLRNTPKRREKDIVNELFRPIPQQLQYQQHQQHPHVQHQQPSNVQHQQQNPQHHNQHGANFKQHTISVPANLNYEGFRLYGGRGVETHNSNYYKKSQINENIKRINNAYRADRRNHSPPLVQQFDVTAALLATNPNKSGSINNNINGGVPKVFAGNNNFYSSEPPVSYNHRNNQQQHARHFGQKTEHYDEDNNKNYGNQPKPQS